MPQMPATTAHQLAVGGCGGCVALDRGRHGAALLAGAPVVDQRSETKGRLPLWTVSLAAAINVTRPSAPFFRRGLTLRQDAISRYLSQVNGCSRGLHHPARHTGGLCPRASSS